MADVLLSAGPRPEPCPSEAFAIDLSGVSKHYGSTRILDNLDLRLDGGAFTVVLGPSGCGKSTLLRLIAGLEDLSGGSIAIGGRVIDRLPPKDRGCAMVFQNYALYPHMTIAENIGYGLKLAKMPPLQRRERVREVAAMLGLADLLSRKPGELSGGQRQRVAIGRAIARRPRVLLFDEPLSNLDAQLRQEMRIELRRLHDEIGATSVFVTHDQTEAMTLADRVIVMNRGRVEQAAAPAEIYRRPASLFVAGFVGSPAMNFLPARARLGQVQLTDDGRITEFRVAAAEGDPLVVGIRPEDVAIVTREAPLAPGTLSLGGRVVAVEDLGSHVIVHCQIASQRVLVQTRRADGLEQGTGVTLALDPERTLIFDSASGRRIPSAPRDTLQ